MTTIWIVTRELNAYEQYGAYFVAAYRQKPTREQIRVLLAPHVAPLVLEESITHLLAGGGRIKYEEEWYLLQEVKEGVCS